MTKIRSPSELFKQLPIEFFYGDIKKIYHPKSYSCTKRFS